MVSRVLQTVGNETSLWYMAGAQDLHDLQIWYMSWPGRMGQRPTKASAPPWTDPLCSPNKIRFRV
jgi:hypothetical protein